MKQSEDREVVESECHFKRNGVSAMDANEKPQNNYRSLLERMNGCRDMEGSANPQESAPTETRISGIVKTREEYEERSKALKLPYQCPLAGKCERWAMSLYQINVDESKFIGVKVRDHLASILESQGIVPSDTITSLVPMVKGGIFGDEPFYAHDEGGDCGGTFLCPEISMSERDRVPAFFPELPIVSIKAKENESEVQSVSCQHFSECGEFIMHKRKKQSATGSPTKSRTPIKKWIRYAVFQRDGFRCVYCGQNPREDGIKLHLDHRVSVDDGGDDSMENLCTACADCNFGKSNLSVRQQE